MTRIKQGSATSASRGIGAIPENPSMPGESASAGMLGLSGCPVCGQAGGKPYLQGPDRFHGRTELYQLVRCVSCGMVWLRNPPEPAQMGQHYGPDYDRFIGRAGESSPEREQGRRATVLNYKSSGSILDLGCNSGSFLATFKGQPWDLYGIEFSRDAAKSAKARTGAEIFVGDVLDAPFPPASFDAITAFDVLEHLYQPRQTMAQVAAWLKPGGLFVLQVPNIDSGDGAFFWIILVWIGTAAPPFTFFAKIPKGHLAAIGWPARS